MSSTREFAPIDKLELATMDKEDVLISNQRVAQTFKMTVITGLCLLCALTLGGAISFGSIALPYLLDQDKPNGIILDQAQGSWIAALNSSMQMVGNLLASWLMDRIGRKKTLVVGSILNIIASAFLSFSINFEMLLVGSIVNGTSCGLLRPPLILLIIEISLIRLRGAMGSVELFVEFFGYLAGLMIGSLVNIHMMPWITVGPCVVFLLFSWYVIESPVWLVRRGRADEARKNISWLRGSEYQVEPEIKEIESLITSVINNNNTVTFTDRKFMFPLILVSFMFSVHGSVGMDDLSTYGPTIFKYPGVDLDANVLSMLFQVAFIVGFAIVPFLMTKIGRRPQFIVGSFLLAIVLTLMGVVEQYKFIPDHGFLAYTPVILHFVFGLVYSLGMGPVPFTLTGELFPQHLKSFGCGITMACRFISQFFILKIFMVVKDSWGLASVYWMHALVALVASVVAFFMLPETKNKTYTELSNIYSKKEKPVVAL